MGEEFTVLATPRIYALYCSDMRELGKINKQLDDFLLEGIPLLARKQGFMAFGVQISPPLRIAFLASQDLDKPDFLILSGTADGLGPTEEDIPSAAKGIFPTRGQIREGKWDPLIRIYFA